MSYATTKYCTFRVVEHDAREVVESEHLVDVGSRLQVVLVASVMLVQLGKHTAVSSCKQQQKQLPVTCG